jgi:catechol 2,3-dioxygenase-like lactoylglutathione lyase family enzyme
MMPIEIDRMTPLLSVFNMPTALKFYRDVLGFEVGADSGNGDDSSWVWLRLGDVNLMLNDQYEPGSVPESAPADRTKWHHDTCLYFRCPDPDAAYEYLRSKEIACEKPKNAPYGMKQLYVHDPDGYNLCFQWPVEK